MMKNLSLLCKFFREYFSMSGKALKGKLQENLFFKIQLKVSFKEIGFFSRLISFERFFKHSSREQNLSHKKTFGIQEEDEQCLPWEKRKVLLW